MAEKDILARLDRLEALLLPQPVEEREAQGTVELRSEFDAAEAAYRAVHDPPDPELVADIELFRRKGDVTVGRIRALLGRLQEAT